MSNCNDFPTTEDMKALKLNSDFETEFVESSAFTAQTPQGQTKLTITGIANKAGGVKKGNYLDDPLLEDNLEYAYFVATQTKYKIASGVTAPYQVDSSTYPDPEADPNLVSFDYITNGSLGGLTNYQSASVADALNGVSIYGTVTLNLGQRWAVDDYYGGAAPNNSGVLFFKVVAAGTGTADGGKYIDVPGGVLQLEQNIKLSMPLSAYGARGNGVDMDLIKIRNAISYAKTSGVHLVARSGDRFNLGSVPDDSNFDAFTIDFDNFVFETNNCEFLLTASLDPFHAGVSQCLFRIQDASNVSIGDFEIDGVNVARPPSSGRGLAALYLRSQSSLSNNVRIGNVNAKRCEWAAVSNSSNPTSFRYSDVQIASIKCDGGYYGVNFADNVDGFKTSIFSNDMVRSYFVYGVDQHDVDVFSTNHFTFTDILIKRYERDTSNITLKYISKNDLSSDAALTIEHQNDTDDGKISNFDISYKIDKANTSSEAVRFSAFTIAGVERTTSNSITDNIRIFGETNVTPITLRYEATGKNVSRIYTDDYALNKINNTRRFLTKTSTGEIYFSGDTTSSFTGKINMSEYALVPFGASVSLWSPKLSLSSSTDSLMTSYDLIGQVISDGNVNFNQIESSTNVSVGTPPTITISNGGLGSFDINVLTSYSDPSSVVKGRVKVLSSSGGN